PNAQPPNPWSEYRSEVCATASRGIDSETSSAHIAPPAALLMLIHPPHARNSVRTTRFHGKGDAGRVPRSGVARKCLKDKESGGASSGPAHPIQASVRAGFR